MNFNKNFSTYGDYAVVQKKVACKLITLLEESHYGSILELGCGTGFFTRELVKNFKFDRLDVNDYFNTTSYLEDIQYNKFIEGDMTKIHVGKYDLICSSSAFQWVEDLDSLFKNLSNCTSNLVFSIYIEGNLIEIKNHFNISLNYLSLEEIFAIAKKYFKDVECSQETFTLNFKTPLEALKHLKKTGVSGIGKTSLSVVKSFKDSSLTYRVAYFKCINN